MRRSRKSMGLAAICGLLLFTACDGDDGKDGKDGEVIEPPTSTEIGRGQPAPGIVSEVMEFSGGTGPNGNFLPGDTMSLRFTLEKDDGSSWSLDEMDQGRIVLSGPTFNYQRVVAELRDVPDLAIEVEEGVYEYTFVDPIPDVYLAPINDGPDYDEDDGELTGQPLLDGTYTVSLSFRWDYTVNGQSFRDVANAHGDFLMGNSATLAPRDVARTEGCNQCHDQLQFHGGLRRTVTSCLMCHTAGMESSSPPNSVLGKTESLDFQAMVHRIHSGHSLPSVQGVTTDATGMRDYTVPPASYKYEGVVWPVWPSLANPMPRDTGYSMLAPADQDKEDAIRSGPTSCFVCHGDPDGDGPIEPPSQGDLIYDQPSRRSCTPCHDDWIPELPYTANTQTMPAQLTDSACILCHPRGGNNLAVMDGHLHPLLDTSFAEGVHIEITDVVESGGNMDGIIDPGEAVEATFTLQNEAGGDVDPAVLGSLNLAVHGPTKNSQLLLSDAIPADRLTGAQPYTTTLPELVFFEYVGDGTGGASMFPTARTPHWNLSGAETVVYERTGTGGSTTLAFAAEAPINYIDVVSSAGFARDDYLVIDDGMSVREYLRIQWVDGNRLWFSSPATTSYAPGPVQDHPAGAVVTEVTLSTLTEGADYTLDTATGTISGTFGGGNAIVTTYTTDFLVPTTYGLSFNAGPDLGEPEGGFAGKDFVDFTYTLAIWAGESLTLDLWGESNSYKDLSPDAAIEFQIGALAGTTPVPYDAIDSVDGCYRCHQDLAFHGNNRRGVVTCLACHAVAAAGDRPRYVAANAPETEGVNINFREMVHKIHRGEDLSEDYTVVGFGFGYPDNFSTHTYEEVVFPTQPAGTQACTVCHGEDNEAWKEPFPRDHPTQQEVPVQNWTIVCAACHDSSASRAHIEANTSPVSGAESCSICHGQGRSEPVDILHMIR